MQKLSPLQIQRIKLLELPSVQLEERIKQEVEENPALDADEQAQEEADASKEISVEEYVREHEAPSYRYHGASSGRQYDQHANIGAEASLQDYLMQQLSFRDMTPREMAVAEYLVGSIDDDGYLRRELGAVADDIAFSLGVEISVEELERALKAIQTLEPAGIGARNLRECLLLQMEAAGVKSDSQQLAHKIIANRFEDFSQRRFEKIISRLGVDEARLREAVEEIRRLWPKPGNLYNEGRDNKPPYIMPDFVLDMVGDRPELTIAPTNIPRLTINRNYADMLLAGGSGSLAGGSYGGGSTSDGDSGSVDKKQSQEAAQFVREKIDSAQWFISSIRKRQETMMRTMTAILKIQSDYFRDGDVTRLKPMILKDIATATGFDISTVSRAISNKYIQTRFGVIPLKQLFSEAIQTDSGGEVSSMEIKQLIVEAVEEEDKLNPLNDEQLLDILVRRGYRITRRTVAKYREMLGIDVARLRRSL
jgi:RNA polymerase sigma-54 factor